MTTRFASLLSSGKSPNLILSRNLRLNAVRSLSDKNDKKSESKESAVTKAANTKPKLAFKNTFISINAKKPSFITSQKDKKPIAPPLRPAVSRPPPKKEAISKQVEKALEGETTKELKKKVFDIADLLASKQPVEQTTKDLLEPLAKKNLNKGDVFEQAKALLTDFKVDETVNLSDALDSGKPKFTEEDHRMLIEKFVNESAGKLDSRNNMEGRRGAKRAPRASYKDNEEERLEMDRAKKQTPFEVYHDLYGSEPLSLFTGPNFKPAVITSESKLWQLFRENRLESLTSVAPLNGFDEAIKLTNEKKLWHFPIDNEQGLDSEDKNEPFYEHVLLDHYLEEFAEVEQIRNFMKLVLNGLSSNPFLTVAEKRDMINWYKEYFTEKLDLIKEAVNVEQLNREALLPRSENKQ